MAHSSLIVNNYLIVKTFGEDQINSLSAKENINFLFTSLKSIACQELLGVKLQT